MKTKETKFLLFDKNAWNHRDVLAEKHIFQGAEW